MFKNEYEIYMGTTDDYFLADKILMEHGIYAYEAGKAFDGKKFLVFKASKKKWKEVKHILVRNVKSVSFDGRDSIREWNDYIYKFN